MSSLPSLAQSLALKPASLSESAACNAFATRPFCIRFRTELSKSRTFIWRFTANMPMPASRTAFAGTSTQLLAAAKATSAAKEMAASRDRLWMVSAK